MATSIFLAKILGLFFVISTTAILTRYKDSLAYEEESVKSPAAVYLAGFLILILGILLVVSHNIWSGDWRLVITILGWLVLLKGVIRIFFPQTVKKLIEKKKTTRKFMIGEVVVLITGLYLLYYGFIVY